MRTSNPSPAGLEPPDAHRIHVVHDRIRAECRADQRSLSNMKPATPVTVALVEDDASIRDRFARVIDTDPTLPFAFGAANATDLFVWFAENPVDVLLVDLGLPDVPGLEVIRR